MDTTEQPRNLSLERVASGMIFFGLVAFVGADYIALGISLFGLPEFIQDAAAFLALLAPVGAGLGVFARREQIRSFLAQVKKDGLTKTLNDVAEKRDEEELQKINDPLARKVSWSAIRPNAAMLPMTARFQGSDVLVVGHRQWPFFAGALVVTVAAVIAFSPFWSRVIPVSEALVPADLMALFQESPVFLVIPAALLAIAGSVPLLTRYQTMTFDKALGTLTLTQPKFVLRRIKERHAPLSELHAIQVIRFTKTSGGENSTTRSCYEVVLVRKNAARVWIMSGASYEAMLENAQRVGSFLGLPVWNRTRTVYDPEVDLLKSLDA